MKFPEYPTVWLDALKKSKSKVVIPPDELFNLIWPD